MRLISCNRRSRRSSFSVSSAAGSRTTAAVPTPPDSIATLMLRDVAGVPVAGCRAGAQPAISAASSTAPGTTHTNRNARDLNSEFRRSRLSIAPNYAIIKRPGGRQDLRASSTNGGRCMTRAHRADVTGMASGPLRPLRTSGAKVPYDTPGGGHPRGVWTSETARSTRKSSSSALLKPIRNREPWLS